jgi:hypothetical protein
MQFKVPSLKSKSLGFHDLLTRKIRIDMAVVLWVATTGLQEILGRPLGMHGEWQSTSIQIQTHKVVSRR